MYPNNNIETLYCDVQVIEPGHPKTALLNNHLDPIRHVKIPYPTHRFYIFV